MKKMGFKEPVDFLQVNLQVLILFKEGLEKEVRKLKANKDFSKVSGRKEYLIAMTEAQIRICEYILEGKFS